MPTAIDRIRELISQLGNQPSTYSGFGVNGLGGDQISGISEILGDYLGTSGQQNTNSAIDLSRYQISQFRGYENGGVVADYIPFLDENLSAYQAEKYNDVSERVVLPTLEIVKTNAKVDHSKMDDDEVTDVSPKGSYVASARPDVIFTKEELDDVIVGIKTVPYSERKTGKLPEVVRAGDIVKTETILPAEYADRITKEFPIKEYDDIYTKLANDLNLQNRKPYIETLITLGEEKRIEQEGDVSTELPKAPFGAIVGGGLSVLG